MFDGKAHLHSAFQNFGLPSLTFISLLVTWSERESDHARVLAYFRLSTRKIPRYAGLVQGNNYRLVGRDAMLFGSNGQRFRETNCLHLHVDSFFAVKMEAVR